MSKITALHLIAAAVLMGVLLTSPAEAAPQCYNAVRDLDYYDSRCHVTTKSPGTYDRQSRTMPLTIRCPGRIWYWGQARIKPRNSKRCDITGGSMLLYYQLHAPRGYINPRRVVIRRQPGL